MLKPQFHMPVALDDLQEFGLSLLFVPHTEFHSSQALSLSVVDLKYNFFVSREHFPEATAKGNILNCNPVRISM